MEREARPNPQCDNCGTWVNVRKSRDNIYRCGKCRLAIITFLKDQIVRLQIYTNNSPDIPTEIK